MRRRGAWAVAAVVAAASMVLLFGCAGPRVAPPSGLSDQEVASYRNYVDVQSWANVGLPAIQKPRVKVVELGEDEWSEALGECYEQSVSEGALSVDETDVAVADYVCRARYQLKPGDLRLLNSAQLDYLYDYYQDTLVPCAGVHGVVLDDLLDRATLVSVAKYGPYPWNPLDALGEADLKTVAASCPPYPPDAIFDRFRESRR